MLIDGKTQLEFAIQALEDIANPIGALQRYAKEQGRQLDGHMAVQLSKNPGYPERTCRRRAGYPAAAGTRQSSVGSERCLKQVTKTARR